jgi:hypothetical protein
VKILKSKVQLLLAFMLVLFPAFAGAQIINGGFENDLFGWTSFGNIGIATTATLGGETFLPYSGEKMGAIAYPAMTGYVWENGLSQGVPLGPDDNFLVFYYNFWTFDEAPFDSPGFTVQINGNPVFSIGAGDVGDGVVGTLDFTGWMMFSYDVSEYYSNDPLRPLTMQLLFNAGNSGDNQYPSGVFLDEIQLNPVPVPPTLVLLATGLIGLVGVRRRKAK